MAFIRLIRSIALLILNACLWVIARLPHSTLDMYELFDSPNSAASSICVTLAAFLNTLICIMFIFFLQK